MPNLLATRSHPGPVSLRDGKLPEDSELLHQHRCSLPPDSMLLPLNDISLAQNSKLLPQAPNSLPYVIMVLNLNKETL